MMAVPTMDQGIAYERSGLTRLADRWQLLALGVLLAGAVSPQSPPTAIAILDPSRYQSLWSIRLGPFNLFELGLLLAFLAWLIAGAATTRTSSLDRPLLAAALAVAALQVGALALNARDVDFLAFDLEHLLIPASAYLVVTRALPNLAWLERFTVLLAALVVLRALELVLVHGIVGTTDFGTVVGRTAILITEDSLLLLLPCILAWGAFVDGRLDRRAKAATLALVAGSLVVNLLSLRRGAMIFTAGALGARTLSGGRRARALLGAVIVLVSSAVAFGGSSFEPLSDVRYTVRSAVLQSGDASTSQRTSELRNFPRNVEGVDWLVGRGLGTIWRAEVTGPVDAASFGSGETTFRRIGWHVYGLDWAYKLGALGLACLAVLLGVIVRRVRAARPLVSQGHYSLMLSLLFCLPVFGLFAFTNLRVGLFAGIALGLVSRVLDAAKRESTPPQADSSIETARPAAPATHPARS